MTQERTQKKLKQVNALIAKGWSANRALKKIGMAWVTYHKANEDTAAPTKEDAQTATAADMDTLEEIIKSNLTTTTKINLVKSLVR